ncbi:MAG: GTP-binding protein [Candidatus Omnitrophota bacterium]
MAETAIRPKMNIVIVGHVDHGKSTLVGRLLADTDSLPKGKLEQVKKNCERNAKPFEYAFLLDALKDEQSQGITIDSARCFFKSKKREYIIIDAPGHIEFLKNMVSGAARAEAALLLIDAQEGIRENSKRHGYLLSMLGIRQVAVCVNKMDLVGYKQKVFREITAQYAKFLEPLGVTPKVFIPIAARLGENIVKKSAALSWYKGPSVLSVLDSFQEAPNLEDRPFRMPVQGVYKFTAEGDDRRILAGRVESGSVQAGDKVIFLPSHKRSEIHSVEEMEKTVRKKAAAGSSTGLTLKEQIYINRGEIMCKEGEPQPLVSTLFEVHLFWMGKQPMVSGKEYKLKIGTAKTPVWLKKIKAVMDASNLAKEKKDKIERHDVAECVLECSYPVAFDISQEIETTGRFVIVDRYDIAGGGIIKALVKDTQAETREQVQAREMKWDFSIIEPKARAASYGHLPKLVLLTGKVGVDKKTVAKLLEKNLFEKGKKVYFLGIGNLLRGLGADVEKDRASRREHVRRLAEVSHLLMDAGLIVIATASGLNDEELRMIQEVTTRDAILVVNVGANDFREGAVDLELDPKIPPQQNARKIGRLLESEKVLSPEARENILKPS